MQSVESMINKSVLYEKLALKFTLHPLHPPTSGLLERNYLPREYKSTTDADRKH